MVKWLKAIVHGNRGILQQDLFGELVVSKQARPRVFGVRNPADNSTAPVDIQRPARNWSIQLWHASATADMTVTVKARNVNENSLNALAGSVPMRDYTGDSAPATIDQSAVPWETVTSVIVNAANPVQTIEIDTTLATYRIEVSGTGAGGIGAIVSY